MLNGPSAMTSDLESSPYRYRWERLKGRLAAEVGDWGDRDMSMVIVSNFEIMVKRGDSEIARVRCAYPRVARCYMSSGRARSFELGDDPSGAVAGILWMLEQPQAEASLKSSLSQGIKRVFSELLHRIIVLFKLQ